MYAIMCQGDREGAPLPCTEGIGSVLMGIVGFAGRPRGIVPTRYGGNSNTWVDIDPHIR
jgi:hypothetical protein